MLLHSYQVSEVWGGGVKAIPARGEVQRGEGDEQEREGIQGGQQGVGLGQEDGGAAGEDEEGLHHGQSYQDKFL